ncbi:MAG: alanine--tRNA ligase [Candidatus Nealsonbacteria bacterium]|nr:alanine--tRNA ligase [Candidatus Nealsonbacteria bacterium]
MNSFQLRQAFLKFFEKKGHKIVPSSSLIPYDSSVLFTTAGMQQFKPYYLGEQSPLGPNVVSCQKCVRTSDIEEVGDKNHLTFLEMLGNFSFGGYFKEEAIKLAYEFLFEELKMPLEKAFFTVFEGDENVPEDKESILIWKKLGIREESIKKLGRKDNFWGPTGSEGPCGPTTEIHFYDADGETEVWNLVFNEYFQDKNGKLTFLEQKGVDTGMGLERLAMVYQGKNSIFETDLFEPIIKELNGLSGKILDKEKRIIADHIKTAVFLISEGILPSNVEGGYILRRILREPIIYGRILKLPDNFLIPLAEKVIENYKDVYLDLKSKGADILTVIQNEEEKFEKVIESGIKKTTLQVSKTGELTADIAFKLYESSGTPLVISKEVAVGMGARVPQNLDAEFKKLMEKHQEISRAGAEGKFGGVGKEANYQSAKLHTATHLLHAALRKILGGHVKQMGSDITPERLRFDFSHPLKMTKEEIEKVEEIVNQIIKDDLEVKKEEMKYEDAIESGALAFFKEKYPEKVSVYSVGNKEKETPVIFQNFHEKKEEKPEPIKEIRPARKEDGGGSKNWLFVFLLLILVSAGGFCYFKLAKATITIWPKTEDINVTTKLTVDKGVGSSNFAEKIIPGEIFEEEKVITDTISSTGKVGKEEKAEGTIKVYNEYSDNTQVLIVNTRFVSTSGKVFRSVSRVVIPGLAYDEKNKIVPGSIDVKVIADQAGPDYNVGPSTFSVPGFAGSEKYTKFYGKSSQPMAGGSSQEVSQVTKEDLDNAKIALSKRVKQECESSFLEKLKGEKTAAGYLFSEDAIQTEVIETFSLATPGMEADTFSYQAKAKSQTIIFKKLDMGNFTKEFVLSQTSQGNTISEKSTVVKIIPENVNLNSGKIILSLDISTKAYWDLDLSKLKEGLKGKTAMESNVLLESTPEISRVEVKLWPFWVRRIPEDLEKINISLSVD